jgi:hypothetical protein
MGKRMRGEEEKGSGVKGKRRGCLSRLKGFSHEMNNFA